MARRYKVKGTRNYLITSIVLLLLSLWFIRDGWFPSQHYMDKYPLGTESFYLFNKITGVALAVGSAVCAYIHHIVK